MLVVVIEVVDRASSGDAKDGFVDVGTADVAVDGGSRGGTAGVVGDGLLAGLEVDDGGRRLGASDSAAQSVVLIGGFEGGRGVVGVGTDQAVVRVPGEVERGEW